MCYLVYSGTEGCGEGGESDVEGGRERGKERWSEREIDIDTQGKDKEMSCPQRKGLYIEVYNSGSKLDTVRNKASVLYTQLSLVDVDIPWMLASLLSQLS